MQKTIEVVYEKGVFKPLEPVELELKEGEEVDIRIEGKKKTIRKIEASLMEYNDFLPEKFGFTLKTLRTNSRERFKRLGIIP